MDNETENLENDLSPDNGDGFKFAVTLIVAFSTIAYKIYDFVKNNPVNDFWYNLLGVIIPVSLTIVGLLAYLIIKGISFEFANKRIKNRLNNFSSYIYISTFLIFFWYVILEIISKALDFLISETKYYFKDEIIIYVEILVSIFVLGYSFSRIIRARNLFRENNIFWGYLVDLKKVADLIINKYPSEKRYEFFLYMYRPSLLVILVFIIFTLHNLFLVITKTNIDWNNLSSFINLIIFIQLVGVFSYIWNTFLIKLFISDKSSNPQGNRIYLDFDINNLHLVFLFIVIIGFCLTPLLLAGNIIVNIDENYFAKNNQIPVDILNTGHNEKWYIKRK